MPLLVLTNRYYTSNFEREVTTQPSLGTRSGTNYHAHFIEEINEIIDAEPEMSDFHQSMEQCDLIDDIIDELLNAVHNQRDVPKNIAEAMSKPEVMEAMKHEIEMIQKFRMWKLVPRLQVPSGNPIFTLIW